MAKVSIIIPTYNVEMYLVECMESVVNQTLKDIEIICINDGSTDGSLEILKSYAQKDDRIVLVDKENGGYGIGMNIGLDKATGEYIGIVEPDDFIPLNMYSDLYEKAVENDLDFIKADFYRFKRDSETEDMELVYNHLSPNKEDYNIVFNPSETPKAMEQLELAYLDARNDANINQLLLIPCVILDFLCIHPFRDGNGRMSRLLSLLLLYKNGFDAGKYVSFEEQINNYKAYYYEALRQSSAGWETNQNSYFPFIENFLSTLYMCYKELDKRFAVIHGKKITKKARVEATVLNSLTPLSKADICKILPDVSPTTIEAVLGTMVKNGSVKRIGTGRLTRYIKA